jgi:hypothetical protein
MKAYGGVDVSIHVFLTSALAGGEWSASRPCRFTPGTHWIGGWVVPIADLHDVETKLGLCDPSVVQPVARSYACYAVPAPVTLGFAYLMPDCWLEVSLHPANSIKASRGSSRP